jgi:hypothetical protein
LDAKLNVLEEARSLIQRELEGTASMTTGGPHTYRSQSLELRGLASSVAIHHASTTDSSSNNPPPLTLIFQGTEETASATQNLQVSFRLGDVSDILKSSGDEDKVDVVIAAAFLDLMDLRSAVPLILSALNCKRGIGAFYFPVNFDGVTALQPPSRAGIEFDRLVETEFHDSMGADEEGGRRSETGRRLLGILKMHGACGIHAGSSAWIVSADANGEYFADEKYFLQCIIEFIESAVSKGSIGLGNSYADALANHLEYRREQIRIGVLTYVAHNLDYCGYTE